MSPLFIDWQPEEVLLSIPIHCEVGPFSLGVITPAWHMVAWVMLLAAIVVLARHLIVHFCQRERFAAPGQERQCGASEAGTEPQPPKAEQPRYWGLDLWTWGFICLLVAFLAWWVLSRSVGTVVQFGHLAIESLDIRWYALGWLGGILLAYLLVKFIYWREGIDPAVAEDGSRVCTNKFDVLIIYCFVGSLAGSRLGHCIFYDPQVYLTSWQGFLEMFLPFHRDASGAWAFSGYSGLASHGGVIGLIIALWLYARNKQMPFLYVLDMIGVAAAAPSCCIRLGNLMNSEIIGLPTNLPWGFIFHLSGDLRTYGHFIPRHPAQLYEAIAYFVILLVILAIYLHKPAKQGRLGTGFYFGFCLCTIFTFRFLVEFFKEVQGGADNGSTWLNVGQMLSIPIALVGYWCMCGLPGWERVCDLFRPSAAERKRRERLQRREERDREEERQSHTSTRANRFNRQSQHKTTSHRARRR